MYIHKLVLTGCKRLLLNNIQQLEYTPHAPYQMILGTNGSGKSTVLSELSPMPVNVSDYTSTGRKYIELSHQGESYTLESVGQGQGRWRHSFLQGQVEHNPGGTITVQRQLVLQHFGLDQALLDVLQGRTRFTRMGPSQRREWLTRLSRTDYKYALGMWRKFKESSRDCLGAIKHLATRGQDKTRELSMLADITQAQQQAQAIRSELGEMLLAQQPISETTQELERALFEKLDSLQQQSETALKLYPRAPQGWVIHDRDHALSEQAACRAQLQWQNTQLTQAHESLAKAIQTRDALSPDTPSDLEGLEQELATFQQDRDALVLDPLFNQLTDAAAIVQDNERVLEGLGEVMMTLPDNTQRTYSQAVLGQIRTELEQLQTDQQARNTRLQRYRDRLTRITQVKEETCPSCNTRFQPGVDPAEEPRLRHTIEEEAQQLEKLAEARIGLEERLEAMQAYGQTWRQLKYWQSSFPRLQPLWDHLLQEELLIRQPSQQRGILIQWDRACRLAAKAQQLDTWIAEHQQTLTSMRSGDWQRAQIRVEQAESELLQATKARDEVKARVNQIDLYLVRLTKFLEHLDTVRLAQGDLQRLYEKWIQASRQLTLKQAIDTHQDRLASLNHQINRQEALNQEIASLQQQQDSRKDEMFVWDLLVRAISPTEGLIAEQMGLTINAIIEQMNAIIAGVWSHQLTILSCGVDKDELDYRFGMLVGDNLSVSDVSNGSDGQQEMVDLAFVLTVMHYLELTQMPVWLDEPGRGFDDHHRNALMQFVKTLLDSTAHRQLFMVSHYVTAWSVFVGAEHLVLDDRNIVAPDSANKHAVLG